MSPRCVSGKIVQCKQSPSEPSSWSCNHSVRKHSLCLDGPYHLYISFILLECVGYIAFDLTFCTTRTFVKTFSFYDLKEVLFEYCQYYCRLIDAVAFTVDNHYIVETESFALALLTSRIFIPHTASRAVACTAASMRGFQGYHKEIEHCIVLFTWISTSQIFWRTLSQRLGLESTASQPILSC